MRVWVDDGDTADVRMPRRRGSFTAESDQRRRIRDAVDNVRESSAAGVPLGIDCDAATVAESTVEIAYLGVESGTGNPRSQAVEAVEGDVVAARERMAITDEEMQSSR
ncbi:hypothetical protein ACFZC5_08815 [Nocardia gamkensis]|uniref:hypothetical protein n=1 Tax=Nocardia gamkensis TaxID=352869 RepID=UPI0036E84B94